MTAISQFCPEGWVKISNDLFWHCMLIRPCSMFCLSLLSLLCNNIRKELQFLQTLANIIAIIIFCMLLLLLWFLLPSFTNKLLWFYVENNISDIYLLFASNVAIGSCKVEVFYVTLIIFGFRVVCYYLSCVRTEHCVPFGLSFKLMGLLMYSHSLPSCSLAVHSLHLASSVDGRSGVKFLVRHHVRGSFCGSCGSAKKMPGSG